MLEMGGQLLSSKHCVGPSLSLAGCAGFNSTYDAAECRSDMMCLGEGKEEGRQARAITERCNDGSAKIIPLLEGGRKNGGTTSR